MARTGRPPRPWQEVSEAQQPFLDYCVERFLQGNLDNIPADRVEAFKAGFALQRQYPAFSARRRSESVIESDLL